MLDDTDWLSGCDHVLMAFLTSVLFPGVLDTMLISKGGGEEGYTAFKPCPILKSKPHRGLTGGSWAMGDWGLVNNK